MGSQNYSRPSAPTLIQHPSAALSLDIMTAKRSVSPVNVANMHKKIRKFRQVAETHNSNSATLDRATKNAVDELVNVFGAAFVRDSVVKTRLNSRSELL